MTRHLALATLAVAGLAACSDSAGVDPNDLVGSWNATSFVFTSVDNPSDKFDVIAEGGSLTMVVESGGVVTFQFTIEGSSDTDGGTIEVDGDNVTLTLDGDVSTGTISRSGDTLTINLTSGVEFDFDSDGTDDPATVRVVLEKA